MNFKELHKITEKNRTELTMSPEIVLVPFVQLKNTKIPYCTQIGRQCSEGFDSLENLYLTFLSAKLT